MDFSSLHVCMESSNQWLQGTIHEESSGMDSNSSLPSGSGNMLTQCSTTPATESERRLRVPPHEEAAVKCPRCDSTNTKFCYYNNYSLSQPRYFCKACRRYWTKGGTLRNIPVGGVFRKTTTKKVSSKKLPNNVQSPPAAINNQNQLPHPPGPSYNHHSSKDLQLSFQNVQFSNLNKYNMGSLENPRPLNSSSYRNFDYFENSDMGLGVGLGDMSSNYNGLPLNYHGLCSPAFLGMSLEGSSNAGNYTMDSYQRLMLPYDMGGGDNPNGSIDVKPNPKLLSLEWQDQGCSGVEKDSFGYLNGSGSWNGVMNGYGSSTTNPSVYN